MIILIKKVRELRGLTLDELAQRTGISKRTLQKYETGEISPRIDKLEMIAIVLQCGINDLFEITEDFAKESD